MEGQMRLTDSTTALPAEYWEADARIHGALVDDLNTDSLLMLSVRDMPTNTKLNARIYYANEYELEGIEVVANIVSKDLHMAENWKGYKYRLEFAHISEEDCRKLKDLLDGHPQMEKPSKSSDMIPAQPSAMKPSSSPSAKFDMAMPSTADCAYYAKGKCLKKRKFCDICHDEDATNLAQESITPQKSKRRGVGPLVSILSKLSNSFTSTMRDY